MFKTAFLTLALPFVLLAGCGDDGTGGSTRSTAEIQAEWGQHCDTFASCPDGRDATSCKAEFTCLEALLRPDMLDKTVACENARVCTTGDDACYSTEAQGVTPSAAAQDYETHCKARISTCTSEGTTFTAEYCDSAAMFKDKILSSLSACLEKPCVDIRTCFDTAIVDAGCPQDD